MRNKCLSRLLSLSLAAALLLGLLPSALAADGALTVSLSHETLSLRMGSGVSAALTATAKVGEADTLDGADFHWESDDERVAVVSGNGSAATVTAVGPGHAVVTLTVTVGEMARTAACTVEVSSPALDSLRIYVSSPMVLEVGEERTLTAVPYPGDADLSDLKWTCDKDEIVSVTAGRNGVSAVVRGVAPGDGATVTAEAGGQTAACTISVRGLVVSPRELSLTTGRSATLSADSKGGSSAHVTWSSGNESVAMVNPSTGEVTGQGPGTTQITAASGDNYTDSCTVTVTENTAGAITERVDGGEPLSFSGLEDKIDRECRDALGSSLSYVTNLSVPTDQGILYYGYVSADDTGAGVGSLEKYYSGSAGRGERSLSNVTFLAKGDFSGTAVIRYTGYNSVGRFFNGTIRVEVEETADVVYSTGKNVPAAFRASDFSAVCRSQNGRDMSAVRFTLPAARYGTLYYNYGSASQPGAAVEAKTDYNRSRNPYLDNVTFVPAKDYTGTVRIPYSGEDTSGNRFSGRVTVYVSGSGSGTGSGDISYSADKGKRVTFKTADFNDFCKDATGSNLDYVRFDPPATSRGTLYYGYTGSGNYDDKVSSSDRYYRSGSPALSRVSFVPKSGFTGTVEIDFTGYSLDGERFSGTVGIDVGGASYDTLTYYTDEGEPVDFTAGDFNDACKDELDETLDYVRFDLPSSSKGVLYYDYTGSGRYESKVSASTRYRRNGSPYLSRVTFLPKAGYTGTVEIGFTGYGVDGGRFTGTVEVIVGGGGENAAVTYTAKAGRAADFSAADFNAACREVRGAALDYVRFDLPESGKGTLYYNYTSGGGSDGRVSSTVSYYRTGGSRQLSKVSFVPAAGFDGRVDIDFTGYDVDGGRFSGVVRITVDGADTRLRYTVKSFETLPLDAADFNSLCKEITGRTLSYVKLSPPPSGQGVLYYDYDPGKGKGGSVASSTAYYRTGGSRQLDRVTLVPDGGFAGIVEIPFTGWSTGGEKFTGSLSVEVVKPAARAVRCATSGAPADLRAADFAAVCREVTAGELDYVLFTQPESGVGRIYYDYTGAGGTGAQAGPAVRYYRAGEPSLDRLTFVPKAGYEGTATVPYTGTDTEGRSFSGTLELTVTAGTAPSVFQDMADYGWAAASVDYLYQSGVVKGTGASAFGPGQPVTRGDFVLMLCRAFDLNAEGGENFPDVPEDSYYAGAVATARELGIARGAGDGRFYPTGLVTRQDAAVFLQNAMRCAGWSIPDGSAARLSGYPDAAAVSDYAVGAVAAMVDLGILRGTGGGRLAPGDEVTRAELAVLLHRALTL